MTEAYVNSYPDFGALSNAFESYRNSVSTAPLLAGDALDRVFADAAYKARTLRRVRLQWALTIAAVAVVTLALILELSQPTKTPLLPKPNVTVKTDTTTAIRKADTISDNSSTLQAEDFRLSKYNYDSHLNLDSAVQYDPNLGPDYRQADWNDLIEFCTPPGKIDTLIRALEIPLLVNHGVPGAYDSTPTVLPDSLENFYVAWGHKRWVMPDTQGYHFYVGRWDHHRPKWWQRYAQLDNDHLDLGAWTGINFRILALRRKAIHEFSLSQHKKQ